MLTHLRLVPVHQPLLKGMQLMNRLYALGVEAQRLVSEINELKSAQSLETQQLALHAIIATTAFIQHEANEAVKAA